VLRARGRIKPNTKPYTTTCVNPRTGHRFTKKCRTPLGFRYPKALLSLLFVCRQIYVEARLLPFSVNDFRGGRKMVEMVARGCLTEGQRGAMRRV
jgi:hypothetical protein